MERFFTADLHWRHGKILELQRTKYGSVEEMEEDQVRNWNEIVRDHDIVYVLGDVALATSDDQSRVRDLYSRLNGHKMLVLGNHDERNSFVKKLGWEWLGQIKMVSVDDNKICLCHYPMQAWPDSIYGSWHLYGHVHGYLPEHRTCFKMDVGMDPWAMRPVSYGQVKDIMSKRQFAPPDRRKAYYESDLAELGVQPVTGIIFDPNNSLQAQSLIVTPITPAKDPTL